MHVTMLGAQKGSRFYGQTLIYICSVPWNSITLCK